jgi:hypothetical protein
MQKASPHKEGDLEGKGGTRGVGGEVVPNIIGSTPPEKGHSLVTFPAAGLKKMAEWQTSRTLHPMRCHMEVVVGRHGESCQRRTAAAMQGAFQEEARLQEFEEADHEQATDQEVKIW